MRQTGTVEDFIQRHLDIRATLLHDLYMAEGFEVYNFARALKPREKQYVLGKHPKTLEETYQHAIDYKKNTINNNQGSQKKFETKNVGYFVPPPTPQQCKKNEATPMDRNAIKTGRVGNTRCYSCGHMGHISRQRRMQKNQASKRDRLCNRGGRFRRQHDHNTI